MSGLKKQIEQASFNDYNKITLEDLREMVKDLKGPERIKFTTGKQGMIDCSRKFFEAGGLEPKRVEELIAELEAMAPEGRWYFDGFEFHLIKEK